VTHIGEIEWDETDQTHVVGRLRIYPEFGGRVNYELHIHWSEDEPTAWCEMRYAFGDNEPHAGASFREETIEAAKTALARQIELEWR